MATTAYNVQLLSSSATSEGAWFPVAYLESPYSVALYGFASGDEAQIWVTNLPTPPSPAAPAAGDGTFQYPDTTSASNFTSDTAVEILGNFQWMRVRKPLAGGSPATTKAYISAFARI